jgi:hypothetical protein
MAPPRRADLIGLFGRDGAETICVAGRPGHVLWTDDFTLVMCAREAFPDISRTWTQAVIQSATVAGVLDHQAFVDASSRLMGWRYVPTQFGVETLVRAAALAGWSAEVWPFPQALEQFGEPRRPLGHRIELAAGFIVRMFAEMDSRLVRQSVIRAVLNQFGSRETAFILGSRLGSAFGLDAPSSIEARGYVLDWLKTAPWLSR